MEENKGAGHLNGLPRAHGERKMGNGILGQIKKSVRQKKESGRENYKRATTTGKKRPGGAEEIFELSPKPFLTFQQEGTTDKSTSKRSGRGNKRHCDGRRE